MIEIFQAITALYNANMGHTLFYSEAEQNTARPYAVLTSPVPAEPLSTFSAGIDDVSVQINIYSDTVNGCFSALAQCEALFKANTLSPAGYHPVKLRREFTSPPIKTDSGWMGVVEYSGLIQKTS